MAPAQGARNPPFVSISSPESMEKLLKRDSTYNAGALGPRRAPLAIIQDGYNPHGNGYDYSYRKQFELQRVSLIVRPPKRAKRVPTRDRDNSGDR